MKINSLEKFTVSLGKRWTNRANLLFFDNHLIALGHLNRIADKKSDWWFMVWGQTDSCHYHIHDIHDEINNIHYSRSTQVAMFHVSSDSLCF